MALIYMKGIIIIFRVLGFILFKKKTLMRENKVENLFFHIKKNLVFHMNRSVMSKSV